jgi:hypothetical protein
LDSGAAVLYIDCGAASIIDIYFVILEIVLICDNPTVRLTLSLVDYAAHKGLGPARFHKLLNNASLSLCKLRQPFYQIIGGKRDGVYTAPACFEVSPLTF